MKKILSLFIVITMISALFTVPALADDGIKVVINGVEQHYDVMPVIINGRTLVPMRGIYEALGAEITWIDATKTVVGARDNTHIKLRINSDSYYVDGVEQEKKLDVPAQIINSRTMVPVRFIAESFGETVNWNGDTKTVEITSDYLKEVAVSDKLAHLDSRFHRPIPREFTKSSELGDWIYYDEEKEEAIRFNPTLYPQSKEIMSQEELLTNGSLDNVNEKSDKTKYGYYEAVDIKEEGISSSKALKVVTSETPPAKNLHVLLFGTMLKGRFEEGDNVLLTFKVRLADGGENIGRSEEKKGQIWASLQETVKYGKTIWKSITVKKDWQTIYIPAVMKEGYDDFAIRFGYCSMPQTVEIADFSMLNFGKELHQDHPLPEYLGDATNEFEPDASWRKDAEKRIEQIRKGDFIVKVTDASGNPVPNATVTFDMYESELPFGSVYQIGLAKKDEYKEAFSKYFNGTVMESCMKWGTFEIDNNDKARTNMTEAKKLGAIYLRDHAMIYDRHMHSSTQRLIPDDVMKAIKDGNIQYVDERTKGWIYRISDLFAGEFDEIDVSNEITVCPIGDKVYKDKEGNDVTAIGGGYYKTLGPEYYDKIYTWVKEVNPDSLLHVTEGYSIADNGLRSKMIYPVLDELMKNENKFSAVGFQGHVTGSYFNPTSLDSAYTDIYNRYKAVTSVTEFTTYSGDEYYDANYTRDFMISSLANEYFNGMYLWGFMKSSATSEGVGDKCFMNYDGKLRPAGEVMTDIIYNKMYTHNVTVTTDVNGEAVIRGFYGNYDVTVDANGKNKKLMAAFHKGYENLLEVNIDDTMYAAIKGENTVKEEVVDNANTEVFVPAATPEIKEEPKKEETEIEIPVDINLPSGGEVILSSNDFSDMIYTFAKKYGEYNLKDGVLSLNVTSVSQKDQNIMLLFKKNLEDLISEGDVCMLTFKVKVNSGTPYLKWQVQANSEHKYSKALFALAEVNGTDWVTCYMPFKGIVNNCDVGVRLGGSVQSVEIKDLQLINYKSSVSLESLPSTMQE